MYVRMYVRMYVCISINVNVAHMIFLGQKSEKEKEKGVMVGTVQSRLLFQG
jgi:hypothetical protein